MKTILVIDAHNIRAGGGLTHLAHLIRESINTPYFNFIHVFGGQKTFQFIKKSMCGNVTFHEERLLNGNLFSRYYWLCYILPKRLMELNADVLFSLGGMLPTTLPAGVKAITMNRNILPFIFSESKKDGIKLLIRRQIQKYLQLRSYQKAHGVIFLSEFARNIVGNFIPDIFEKSIIIPHGVDNIFRKERKKEERLVKNSINLLYVSNIKSYKHQWNVVEAVSRLYQAGYSSINLTLVGPADTKPLKKLQSTIKFYKMNDYVVWLGAVPHEEIVNIYHSASIFVYASSCETFGQTVLEAMASRLPIACSNRGPMHEFAEDSAIYFNPEHPSEIASAIKYIIDDHDASLRISSKAFELSKKYTWKHCILQTYKYIYNN